LISPTIEAQNVETTMTDEIVLQQGNIVVRRLRLVPGDVMQWHRDPFHRIAVVLSGDVLSIEYRDGGQSHRVRIEPGQVDWEEPSARVHRAVNVGEQVTVFLLDRPDAVAQPSEG
jgi:quercetin dioxygenase-like cupin family protein